MKKQVLILFSFLVAFCAVAQQRDQNLKITVSTTTGESVAGLAFTLIQTDYSLDYGSETVLDANGRCNIKVYAGAHKLTVAKKGYKTAERSFVVEGDTEISVTLEEEVKEPFALTTAMDHDVYTGKNSVLLTWNKEAPAFFDDFESYDGFSIKFGDWTGIDGDLAAAAPLSGDYLNRGVLQYAQIINPLTVVPAWWYEYPVLRPYSGKQYVGFIRTSSGQANDDWLISPEITVGTDNILRFMAKAADVYRERFEVGITTNTDNPSATDFEIISPGNYEDVSYEEWEAKVYDLGEYAGEKVKIAIHYMGDANRNGAFMLMVDDFFVGMDDTDEVRAKARRVSAKSPANPNEKFEVYKDGVMVGETESYSYMFDGLDAGVYTLGVKAVYKASSTDIVTTKVDIPADGFSKVQFNVSTNNGVSADGLTISILEKETGKEYALAVADGKAVVPSLPNGTYLANVESEMFNPYEAEVNVDGDETVAVNLIENIIVPFNITADVVEREGNYDVNLKWNQDLGFYDSFEDYDDFEQSKIGDWISVDVDQMPAYPISFGGTEVTFPGSSNSGSTKPIAPIVFNPWKTKPSMEQDGMILPTDGNKEILFFNPQSNNVNFFQTDKWLISPEQKIRENYVVRFNATGYDFSETLEVCVSTDGSDVSSFVKVVEVNTEMQGAWTTYEVDLSAYAGQTVRIGFHCVSYGGWLCMFDEAYIGPEEEGVERNVGNVLNYEVYLDGQSQGSVKEPSFTLTNVAAGSHIVGVKAVYASGESEIASCQFDVAQGGVEDAEAALAHAYGAGGQIVVALSEKAHLRVLNMAGQMIVDADAPAGESRVPIASGSYIVLINGKATKVAVR